MIVATAPEPTVATGRVERGVLHVNEEVEIVGIHEDIRKVVVTGIEMFRKLLDEAQPGDNIGALLRGVQRDEIQRGQVLCKPGSITPHHKFTAQVYVITRHAHFCTSWKLTNTSYISCSEVELWSVVVEEWSMTSTFVLC